MESEIVYTGNYQVTLLQNVYATGEDILLRYRHGNTVENCLAAEWNNYTSPFSSLGYVQIRVESTL